jgi:hypothetical protein
MENKEIESLKEKTEGFKLYLLRLWQDLIDEGHAKYPSPSNRAIWHGFEEKQMCRDFLSALKMWESIEGFSLDDLKGKPTIEPELVKGRRKIPYKERLRASQVAMKTITSQQPHPEYRKAAEEALREFDKQVMQFVK